MLVMPLVTEDIEQVKSIVLKIFQEHFVQPSPAAPKSESERKWDLLERIVRVEEELKYLREDMERRFAEMREDTDRRFTEMNRRFTEMREDMQRNFKFTVWVISGWGTLLTVLISTIAILFAVKL